MKYSQCLFSGHYQDRPRNSTAPGERKYCPKVLTWNYWAGPTGCSLPLILRVWSSCPSFGDTAEQQTQNTVKCFALVHIDDISGSSLIHQHSNPSHRRPSNLSGSSGIVSIFTRKTAYGIPIPWFPGLLNKCLVHLYKICQNCRQAQSTLQTYRG